MYFTYVFVLLWLAYMLSSGVLLFSRGFLLSRIATMDINHCRNLTTDPYDANYLTENLAAEILQDMNASATLCLPPKSKVVILLIDALRYDFGIFKANLTDPLPYENKLPVLHEISKRYPKNARLFRFIADPPTTTLQRLKGITTGSLPTFIDIGSNFATPEINEDNIIDQLINSGRQAVFLGDSTWTDLYPRQFKRFYSYPSFDIFDLDSVDTKIRKRLPEELAKNDWDMLIAHFLGVDHCGHKYGPNHAEMARKLTEMNALISDVIAKLDEDTTLLVMGDHGMTTTGDHGGESNDEVNALLFAYSKKHEFISFNDDSNNSQMQQIDLVPTLATILGIPIPYSNLGLINFNIIPAVELAHLKLMRIMQLHYWQNAHQIFTYFQKYALDHQRAFDADKLESIELEHATLAIRVKSIYSEAGLKSFSADLRKHLREILSICRDIWIKFDDAQMSHGLLITALTIFLMSLIINNTQPAEFAQMFKPKTVAYIYFWSCIGAIFGHRFYKSFNFTTSEHASIVCSNIVNILTLIMYTLRFWCSIASSFSNAQRFRNLFTRIILLILASICFSNSFVIEEPKILAHLLTVSILLIVKDIIEHSITKHLSKAKFKLAQFLQSNAFSMILACLLALALVRFGSFFYRCREEQGSGCSGFEKATGKRNHIHFWAVIAIALYTILTRIYLRSCGNLTGYSINVVFGRYGPTLATTCACCYVLLMHSRIRNVQRSHIDAMALIVFGSFIAEIIVVSLVPLMTYIVPMKKGESITVNGAGGGAGGVGANNIFPEIFKKMKSFYNNIKAPKKRYEIPIVYGLATVYSAVIINFAVFLILALFILLEPTAGVGLILCATIAFILLSVDAIERYSRAKSFENCVQPSFRAIVSWFLLAHFSFFATSHQTTISQIDWRAAFVGQSGGIGHATLLPGLLVICNTFCGHILFFCLYGLLNTHLFSIFALFPALIKTNRQRTMRSNAQQPSLITISTECVGFDITRGELNLFENETVFLGAAFKLAGQFFMLQGAKVFCAMLACTIHCRHLMVWKIFAPRLIYECLATFISLTAIIIGYLLIARIHAAVDNLTKRLNKIQ